MKNSPQVQIHAIIIDPFQHEIYPVMVTRDSHKDIAQLLDCEFIQAVDLGISDRGTALYAWIDKEGFSRQPLVYPHWVVKSANGGEPMAGYGLVTGLNECSMVDCTIPLVALGQVLMFEPWRKRIPLDNVIPQMMRVYELAK